ncbi:DUF2573 family protein [Bacillus mangrovi]|uniref:DUF2573 family protein n=1 Tax=Metabacillus mangrovi TaxID=1491830 RepID=A0A7X2V4L2_9BACI|nr:DUF2573 family protein [Metabacillus mangrovi]MTH53907.1 DUF2573 family protein [Metabacillus mangrovi]
MDQKFKDQFDGLLEKYSDLLVGSQNEHQQEKVKLWSLYTHMAKTMPNLVRHWNSEYPEFKETMKTISTEVKEMNEKHREQNQKKD